MGIPKLNATMTGLLDTVFEEAVFDTDCFDADQARGGRIIIESPIAVPQIVIDSTIIAGITIESPITVPPITIDSTIITGITIESPVSAGVTLDSTIELANEEVSDMVTEVINVSPNGTNAGTTTAVYVEAVTMVNVKGAIININNLAPAATMYYKIDGYRSDNIACIPEVITTATSITAATVEQNIACMSPFARVVISVMQNSAAGPYQIDYITW